MRAVRAVLCCASGPHSEASTLLLYTLLHGSRSFQEYVLVRSDPETLLLPVLQQLYQADKARANHLYMLQVRVNMAATGLVFLSRLTPGLACSTTPPTFRPQAVLVFPTPGLFHLGSLTLWVGPLRSPDGLNFIGG